MPTRIIAIVLLCGWPFAAWAQDPWSAGVAGPGVPMHSAIWPHGHAGHFGPAAYQQYHAPAPVYEELVPREDLYGGDPALDLAVRDMMADCWLRFEYLNWTIQEPENELLGAQMATEDPRGLFPAVDRVTGVRPNVFAFVPDTEDFDLRNQNGLRATIGLPLQAGAFEFSSFLLQQGNHEQRIAPRFDPINLILIIPATTLLDQGVPSDEDMILYDTSYKSELTSQMFGADAKFIAGPYTPNVPLLLQPTFGLKYVQYYEDFSIRGSDTETLTNHVISAKGHNNFITGTCGVRFETQHEFLTLGFEPQLLIGINRHEDSVRTQEIYAPGEAPNLTGEEDTDFAAGMDLRVYGKIHVNERFTIFCAYNALFLSDVARPFDLIRYNDAGLTEPPDITFEAKTETMSTQGISVGGEWYLWD